MIDNPFQINDWKIQNFLVFIITVQLVMLGLLGLSALGIDIPVFRQIVGFIYLTFIPGLIILRILKLHNLGNVETLLYATGLSLTFNMIIGVFMNLVYPYIGISKPISTWPLVATITAVSLVLTFMAYIRDKEFPNITQLEGHNKSFPLIPALLLILLPLLGILGALIFRYYHTNALLLIVILLVALIPVLITFTKFIPRSLYPLAVMTISLTLLYNGTFISNYITGFDIHIEYYFANLVLTNSFWDITIAHPYNTVPSIVILAPAYSTFLELELTWIFKIIYPFLFSLVPLGIYQICKRQIDYKGAFLAAFFFMTIYTFFNVMTALARQEIAELFLVLVVLAIISKSINRTARTILYLTFAVSIIISHYAIAYLFMFILIILSVIILIIDKQQVFPSLKRIETINVILRTIKKDGAISIGFAALYAICCLSWYMWIGGSSAFISGVSLTGKITGNVLTEFLSPTASEAFRLVTTTARSPVHEIAKYLNMFTIFLIGVGILDLLFRWKRKEFDIEFAAFSLISFAVVAAAVPVPYLAKALNTERFYHINLIFLAPFCVTGAIAIFRFLFRQGSIIAETALKAVSIIIAVLLLLNSGFAHEIIKNPTFTGSLIQKNTIRQYGNSTEKANLYGVDTVKEDVFSARWLSRNAVNIDNIKVYATIWGWGQVHAPQSYGMISTSNIIRLNSDMREADKGSYIYLNYLNVVEGIGTMINPRVRGQRSTFNMLELEAFLQSINKIYTDQGSEIFLSP